MEVSHSYGHLITLLLFSNALYCLGEECGHKSRFRRVIGGKEAVPHSWPWLAEIQYNDKGTWYHKCGGSLIYPEWIVTAAHCLVYGNNKEIRIVLGEHDRTKHEGTEQYFNVSECCVHKGYQIETTYGFDIAIIKLSRPATLNSAVGLVCLPNQNQRIHVGELCYLAGWGIDQLGGDKALKLQDVQIPTVNQSTCSKANSFFKTVDNETMLCAGFGGNSSVSGCNGDSGGPLVCKENGTFFLRGAVSWGIPGCPAGDTYSVFARISSFVDWIEDHVKNSDKCTCGAVEISRGSLFLANTVLIYIYIFCNIIVLS